MVLSNRLFYQALLKEGFEIPKACRQIRVIVGVDGAIGLQFDCYLDTSEMVKFGRALQKTAQQAEHAQLPATRTGVQGLSYKHDPLPPTSRSARW